MKSERGGNVKAPRIIEVKVRWNEKWANSPEFEVVTEGDLWHYNPHESVEHICLEGAVGDGLFLGWERPWAHFVYDRTAHGAKFGRGACTGILKLTENDQVRVTDGWSSRAGVVNKYLPDTDHIVDVSAYDTVKYPDMGRHGLAVRVEAIFEMMPKGICLMREDSDGEIAYYPSLDAKKIVKPKEDKRVARR
jgi:hypothetical protein